MYQIQMGEIYFKLTDGVETKEMLEEFLLSLGLEIVDNHLDKYGFSRINTYKSKDGFMFDTIWFKNLCHVRIGEWGKCFFENSFTEIIGSYLPNCDHNTLDFLNDGERTLILSISDAN